MYSKGKFDEFAKCIEEYFTEGHTDPVPFRDLENLCQEIFYLPMHAVVKPSSSTTQLPIVFDASAKSKSSASLNDQLLVGHTIHAPLLDMLLCFQRHKVALITDISRMYHEVLLPENQRDLHCFVWRRTPRDILTDYCMTRLTLE